jgi:hypothetical protein
VNLFLLLLLLLLPFLQPWTYGPLPFIGDGTNLELCPGQTKGDDTRRPLVHSLARILYPTTLAVYNHHEEEKTWARPVIKGGSCFIYRRFDRLLFYSSTTLYLPSGVKLHRRIDDKLDDPNRLTVLALLSGSRTTPSDFFHRIKPCASHPQHTTQSTMRSVTIAVAVAMAATHVLAAAAAAPAAAGTAKGVPVPSAAPLPGAVRSQGCYASGGDLVKQPSLDFVSSGSCSGVCIALNMAVSALHGSDCLCGESYPPKADRTSDSHCNYPCPGYDPEACMLLLSSPWL